MTWPTSAGDILLGKYRVERVLGQGGMGVVVAVRHIELNDLFAMKFLLPAALAHPDAVERFLREARASARLKGEHVVRVQDVGRLPDGMPYMVMEHLAGSDLKDLVQQRGALPVPEALTYVLQACEALAEAHAEGIVHRDLKPANMFLTRRRNGAPCIKVLDFGISKQTQPETAAEHALTRTGMVLGSPLYMSPEQMTRTKEADPRGDIWSMGVVLYELLTGTVPFLADALTELVGKVLQETPLPPSRHRPEIPPDVDALVMTCLQKRREERFQSADQLIEALRAALSRTSAAPLVPAPRASAPAATLLMEQGVFSSSASLPVPTAPTAQTGQAWGATAGAAPAPAAPAPKRAGMAVAAAALGLLVLGGVAFAAWRHGRDSADPEAVLASSGPTPGGAPAGATTQNALSPQGDSPPVAPESSPDPSAAAAHPAVPGRPGIGAAAVSPTATTSAATSVSTPTTASVSPTATAALSQTTPATAAAPACKSRFDCKAPLVCSSGVCVTPNCTGDASCGAGRYCSLEGRCEQLATSKPVPACKSHLDCKAPLVCPAGVCVSPQCTRDADCGAGRFCSLEGQCKQAAGPSPGK